MDSHTTKFEITGEKRWILNDPSFFAYYINQRLKEAGILKRLVQIPPFETHIFTFGDGDKVNLIANKYN